jgi:hypothetical protein
MAIDSANIERINEDFYLNFDGTNDQLKVLTKLPFLVSTADWAFSGFTYITGSSGTLAFLFDNRNSAVVDNTGLSFYAKNITATTYTLTVTVARTGGNTYDFTTTLQTNGFQHIVLSFDNVANDLNLYVNGYLSETINIGSQVIIAGGGTFSKFGSFINDTNFTEGGFLKFAFFDSQLTESEVRYIYEAAEIPESKFSNLQNYYPLNQVAYKDTNNYFSDVVKVYNPSATSYRAEAIGWTDRDLGTDSLGAATATAYKNVKTKSSLGLYGLKMSNWTTESQQGIRAPQLNTNPTPPTPANGITIIVKGKFNDDDNNLPDDGNRYILQYRQAGAYKGISIVGSTGNNQSLTTPVWSGSIGINDNIESVIYTWKPNGDYAIFVDGKKIQSGNLTYVALDDTFSVGFFIGPNFSLDNAYLQHHYTVYFDRALEDFEIFENYSNDDWLKLNPKVAYDFSLNNSDEWLELSGNGLNVARDLTASYHQPTSEDAIDAKTNLEPRKKGLQFNGTSQYLEVSTFTEANTSKGYTIILGVQDVAIASGAKDFFVMDDISSNDVIALGYDESTQEFTFKSGNGGTPTTEKVAGTKAAVNFLSYRIGGTSSPFNYGSYDRVSDVTLQNRDVNASYGYGSRTTGDSIYIGKDNSTNYTDLVIYSCVIIEGRLNDSDLKYLINSGLLNNIKTSISDEFNVLLNVDFNNPFEVTGTLYFPDLSPNNHTITATGWANLAALQAALVDINTLF